MRCARNISAYSISRWLQIGGVWLTFDVIVNDDFLLVFFAINVRAGAAILGSAMGRISTLPRAAALSVRA